jgi:TolB-like protein
VFRRLLILLKGENRMKKLWLLIALGLLAAGAFGQSRDIVSLDEAIRGAADQITNQVGRGSKIIVYQFQSTETRISDYVLKELFDDLVNSHRFTVLDRTAQEVVDAELNFQFKKSAGMVADDSLASLTKRLGAGAIVTGSLDDAGSEYRFRIRVIGTETTAAVASYAASVNTNDRRIVRLRTKTAGEKIGTGALNIVFGLGSHLDGDLSGGLTVTGGYVLAMGLFVIEAAALDWNSQAVGVPATLGIAVASLTFVYGFVRPFIHERAPQTAAVLDNARLNIVPTSDDFTGRRTVGVQLSYAFHL